MFKRYFLLLTFCLLILSTGCGQKLPKGMPKLSPTTIKIAYTGGKTIEGATVMMIAENPAESGGRWTITGITNVQGIAEMITLGQYKGVPSGKYTVIVSKDISEGVPKPGPASDEATAKALEDWKKNANKEKRFALIDPKFSKKEGGLTATIVAGTQNSIEFEVGQEVRVNIPVDYTNAP